MMAEINIDDAVPKQDDFLRLQQVAIQILRFEVIACNLQLNQLQEIFTSVNFLKLTD